MNRRFTFHEGKFGDGCEYVLFEPDGSSYFVRSDGISVRQTLHSLIDAENNVARRVWIELPPLAAAGSDKPTTASIDAW